MLAVIQLIANFSSSEVFGYRNGPYSQPKSIRGKMMRFPAQQEI